MTKNPRYKLYLTVCLFVSRSCGTVKIGEGLNFEKIDVKKGQHQTERYLQLNRHGKVPLLQDDQAH